MLIQALALQPEAQYPPLDLCLPQAGICCLLGSRAEVRQVYLQSLSGLFKPEAGVLRYPSGEPLQLGKGLGYVARQAPLLSVLNGRENALMPAVYHGQKRAQAERDLQAILEVLHFTGDLSLLPAYLTPLERMQLALARAALLRPALLVLEDPWHSLELPDYTLLEEGLALWGRSQSLLMATAHLGFVRKYADQLIFIGADKNTRFPGWEALLSTQDPAIQDYLEGYRMAIDWKV